MDFYVLDDIVFLCFADKHFGNNDVYYLDWLYFCSALFCE